MAFKMVVEDSGNLDIVSGHNVIRGEVVWGRTEVEVKKRVVQIETRWQASLGALSGSSRGIVHRVREGG